MISYEPNDAQREQLDQALGKDAYQIEYTQCGIAGNAAADMVAVIHPSARDVTYAIAFNMGLTRAQVDGVWAAAIERIAHAQILDE